MSWSCGSCTFVNDNPLGLACSCCGSKRAKPDKTFTAPERDSVAVWPCPQCTFENPQNANKCEMCGKEPKKNRKHPPSASRGIVANSSTKLVAEKMAGSKQKSTSSSSSSKEIKTNKKRSAPSELKISEREPQDRRSKSSRPDGHVKKKRKEASTFVFLTWNVWFELDVEGFRRAEEIGKVIQREKPHVICLQEMTGDFLKFFWRSCSWFSDYKLSIPFGNTLPNYFAVILTRTDVHRKFKTIPFGNSCMGRDLVMCYAQVAEKKLTLATTHLESPVRQHLPAGMSPMCRVERRAQLKKSFEILANEENVIFGGDMNWTDPKKVKHDGDVPLPTDWTDCWLSLHPKDPGYTYDAKNNGMLLGSLRRRLDRVFCKGEDFKLKSIEMVGREVISGLTYVKTTQRKSGTHTVRLPVLPSDHFGLLCKFNVY